MAKSLSDTIKSTADGLGNSADVADAVGELRSRQLDIDDEGNGLSAILIHQLTHRTGATGVHRSAMGEHIVRKMEQIHEDSDTNRGLNIEAAQQKIKDANTHLSVTNKAGNISTNPRKGHWELFINKAMDEARKAREAIGSSGLDEIEREQEFVVLDALENSISSTAVALQTDDVTETNRMKTEIGREIHDGIELAYWASLTQGVGAMLAALDASVVDGPKSDHPTQADLEVNANTNPLWKRLREIA
jgi:hypothetical protein